MTLSVMNEKFPFYTRWKIPSADEEGAISCVQEIEIGGLSDTMLNQFFFYDLSESHFCAELNNQSIGKVIGKGFVSAKLIGWEFRLGHLGFEGFEFYEMTGEIDAYLVHAEYCASDDFRTIIHGKLWKKPLK